MPNRLESTPHRRVSELERKSLSRRDTEKACMLCITLWADRMTERLPDIEMDRSTACKTCEATDRGTPRDWTSSGTRHARLIGHVVE